MIGGFAATIRGSPVITGDLDLCHARDHRNLEALAEAPVRVASLDDLMRMKKAAGRTKDKLALEWLGALRDELERDERPG